MFTPAQRHVLCEAREAVQKAVAVLAHLPVGSGEEWEIEQSLAENIKRLTYLVLRNDESADA